MNGAVYGHLHRLHEAYGNMKLGYVRYNDVVYCAVPYLDGYGYFSFTVDNSLEKISDIKGHVKVNGPLIRNGIMNVTRVGTGLKKNYGEPLILLEMK